MRFVKHARVQVDRELAPLYLTARNPVLMIVVDGESKVVEALNTKQDANGELMVIAKE